MLLLGLFVRCLMFWNKKSQIPMPKSHSFVEYPGSFCWRPEREFELRCPLQKEIYFHYWLELEYCESRIL